MSKYHFEKLIVYFLLSVLLSLIIGYLIISYQFDFPQISSKAFFSTLDLIFKSQSFMWIALGSSLGGFSLCGVLFWLYFNYSPAVRGSHIRGSRIISSKKLKNKTLSSKEKQITLAGVPIPSKLETLHFMIGGRTGTGKTVAIKEMLSSIIPRGDRVIITDPNGDFLSHFFKKEDVILNPFDQRGKGWSIFNELGSV